MDISLPKHVEKYLTALKQRHGYSKWVIIDYSDLKAREDSLI